MKKEYFAPAAVYMTVECDTIIAASPISVGIDREKSGNEQLSNKQQGTWGDVWNK